MARFDTVGIADLGLSLEEIARLPDAVIADMLNAGADVIERGQKEVGLRMGVHDTGVTLGSIKKGKVKRSYIDITPEGTNSDGNRNAEVAYINEFGKKGQAPRPFMQVANETYADEMMNAEFKVYDEFLKSKNL